MSRHFCCNLTIEAWHRRFKQPGRSGDATRPSVAGGSPDYSPENVPYQPGLLFQSEVRSVFVIVGDVVRELQRQVPRRVSKRELVHRSGRRAGEDRRVAAGHIAVFGTGDLLVAGIAKGHDVPFVPLTAIFGSDGEFRRQIILSGDVSDKDAKEKQADAKLSEAQRMRDLLDVTFLQKADDGNVYVMRHTPKGPVFVISPGGEVQRVTLRPPTRSADIQWIMASGGSIAAQYLSQDPAERKMHYISVIDVRTNKLRDRIRYSHEFQTDGGGMVCYQHDIFTFIAGTSENKLQLVKAR